MKRTNYRRSEIRPRTFRYGTRVETDYICTHCMAIVPEPEVGCVHCKRKIEKNTARFEAFLASRGRTHDTSR